MTTITNYNGNGIIEELVLSTNDVAALTVIPEYAAVIAENFTGSDNDTDNGSDNDTDNGSNNDTETATIEIPVEVEETIAGGAYVNVNATTLDKYIAIYRQGDMFMKRGMALKMVAVALIEQSELYYDKGYTSITEFAAKEFNLAEQTTRQYLQTAKKFYNIPALSEKFDVEDLVDENGNVKKSRQVAVASIFADTSTGKDFSANSLIAIRALKVDTIKELIDKGELNYEMTGAEIKQAVAPYRKRAGKKASGAETDNDTATDTGSDIFDTIEVGNINPEMQARYEKIKNGSDNGTDTKNAMTMALETIEKLKAELAAANTKIETLAAENETLRTRVISAEKTETKTKEALAIALDTLEKCKAKLAAAEKENDTLSNENQRLIDNAAAQAETIETLTAENKKLTDSNNSYKAANSRAKKANDTLKAELETLKAAGNDASSDTETPVTITGSDNDATAEK